MAWIAFVGPEIEENLSLRYLASSLQRVGFATRILPYNSDRDAAQVLAAITQAEEPPLLVGLSLAFQWRAPDFLALAVALRELGYAGHVTAGRPLRDVRARRISCATFPRLDSVCRQEAEDTHGGARPRRSRRGTPWHDIPGLVARDADGARPVRRAAGGSRSRRGSPGRTASGEPARCFDHGIAPARLQPRLLRELHLLLHRRLARTDAARQALPRCASPRDVAAEMAAMQRDRGIEIFVFHDDNFFIPEPRQEPGTPESRWPTRWRPRACATSRPS